MVTPDELTELDYAVARALEMTVHSSHAQYGCWVLVNEASMRWVGTESIERDGVIRSFEPSINSALCAELAAERCIEHCWKQLNSINEWDAVSAYPALYDEANMDECLERFADHPSRLAAWRVAVCRAIVGGNDGSQS